MDEEIAIEIEPSPHAAGVERSHWQRTVVAIAAVAVAVASGVIAWAELKQAEAARRAEGLAAASYSEPDAGVNGAVMVGCGSEVTLIVDADDLQGGTYEFRASVGDRMLPMTNSMTFPLVGSHRGHQWVVPDHRRLLLVAQVPAGGADPVRYELVDGESEPVIEGTLGRAACSPEGLP